MAFNSLYFALFFGVTWVAYALCPARWRIALLVVASWTAYASWNLTYLGLVLFSAVLDYFLSWRIFRSGARFWLGASLLYNLSILIYFKYANLLGSFLIGLGMPLPRFNAIPEMPVGISFFTFQSMGYSIDVYRKRARPAACLRDYLLFVSFFPQMMAGPIERARGLLRQIELCPAPSAQGFYLGLVRVAFGLFQKVVVADNLQPGVNAAFLRPGDLSGLSLAVAVVLFALQLYADYAGYCDMAIGMAQMLGFGLAENFRAPYLARNLSEVWLRWNITLMAWFRDYVYFPLAGRGRLRAAAAVLVVFTLSGLWHGAAWHFALWGLVNGVLLLVLRASPRLPRALARFFTLSSVVATLLLFRAPSAHVAAAIGARIVEGAGGLDFTAQGISWEAMVGLAVILAVDLAKEPLAFDVWWGQRSATFRWLGASFLGMAILLLGAKSEVRFIYLQF